MTASKTQTKTQPKLLSGRLSLRGESPPNMGEKEKEVKQEDKMEVEKEEEEEKAGSDDEVIQVRTDKKIWTAEKGEGRKIG